MPDATGSLPRAMRGQQPRQKPWLAIGVSGLRDFEAAKGIDGMRSPDDLKFSRRDLLIVGAASLTAPAIGVTAAPLVAKAEVALKPAVPGAPVMSKVSFQVNGKAHELEVDTRTTLLDALREQLHFTGTKKG